MQKSTISKVLLTLAAAFTISTVNAASVHWSYEGESGPAFWGDLSPDFRLCKDGLKQTPINLYRAREEKLPSLQIAYKDTPLTIKNNGHTIQVNYAAGSYLTVGGKKYQLLQFHFHTPSEHAKDGRSFDMEGHLVHIDEYGALGVLGVFMKAGDGGDNEFLKPIWANMPATEGEVEVAGATVNVAKFLPKEREYYNYAGSLTTPPCSEGVNWMVLEESIRISKEQLEKFRSLFELNARPEQPLNGRTIKVLDN